MTETTTPSEKAMWTIYGQIADYTVYFEHVGEVYQISKGGFPGNGAGYPRLESLLKLKNLNIRDLELVEAPAPGMSM